MKRRNFGLITACSIAALGAGAGFPKKARALTTADADRLKADLTPVGAERAGNAAGTIPAWTGDNIPLEGSGPWGILPDFFAGDAKIVSIDASNVDQYKDKVPPGAIALMQKFADYRIDVYPTHRTAIATQEVYDNAYANVTRVQPVAGGSRLGFTGGYGAVPFPILDPNDPFEAGAQAIQNHSCRWFGAYQTRNLCIHTVVNGQLVLADAYKSIQTCPYYFPGGSPETFNGFLRMFRGDEFAPPQVNGESFIEYNVTNPSEMPVEIWEYLVGQGRVRKAPELQYDTPETQANDIINYDESYLWYGSMDRFDWKLVGKKEMYIPYNNNKLFQANEQQAHGPHFVNPDLVRWELHRVYVVEATLHPGARNVLPHRFFYVDEDTYTIAASEAYDASGNLVRIGQCMFEVRPDIPATAFGCEILYSFQTDQYVTGDGPWNSDPYTQPYLLTPISPEMLNPTAMASDQQF